MQTLQITVSNLHYSNPLTTLVAWVRQKIAQHREELANKRHIAYLRTLDMHILGDMGVDIAELGAADPKLAKFVPLF
jgi:hypothetical protein